VWKSTNARGLAPRRSAYSKSSAFAHGRCSCRTARRFDRRQAQLLGQHRDVDGIAQARVAQAQEAPAGSSAILRHWICTTSSSSLVCAGGPQAREPSSAPSSTSAATPQVRSSARRFTVLGGMDFMGSELEVDEGRLRAERAERAR
jgi:hypothetical protein